MNRRDILAAAGSFGVVATAGCTSLGSETISNPSKNQASDGETSLQFQTDGGASVATLTIQPGNQRYSGPEGEQIPTDVALTHSDTTTVTDLTLSLRVSSSGTAAQGEVALNTPFGTPYPSLDLYAAPNDGGNSA